MTERPPFPLCPTSRATSDLRPLQRAYDEAVAYLEGLATRAVGVPVTSAELRRHLALPLPDEPGDPEQVLGNLVRDVERGLVASAGPRYFGFVMGGGLPVAVAADWMTSAWDQNAFGYVGSPAAAVVEEVAAQWLLELLRLPLHASVGFVTGGQMANFTGLAAGRDEVLRRVGWDVVQDGLSGAPPITVGDR